MSVPLTLRGELSRLLDAAEVDANFVALRSGLVPHVPTLAGLRDWPTDQGGLVCLLGLLADGDGGEGLFCWTAADLSAQVTADTLSGIYVAATGVPTSSGAWVRKFIGGVNPEWFGARGGAGSNQAAFHAAFAMGERVVVPARDYTLDGPLTSSRAGLTIVGEAGATLTYAAGALSNDTALLLSGDRARVAGLTVQGDMTGFANSSSIISAGVGVSGDDAAVSDCRVLDFVYGVNVTGERARVTGNLVDNTVVRSGGAAQNNYCGAIRGLAAHNLLASGNTLIGHGSGILLGNATLKPRLTNNFLYLQDDNGIYCSSANDAIITGNVVVDHDGTGIKARGNRNTIANNVVWNENSVGGTAGIVLSPYSDGGATGIAAYGGAIRGNLVHSTVYTAGTEKAIAVDRFAVGEGYAYLDGWAVEGNTISGNADYGIVSWYGATTSARIVGNAHNGGSGACTYGIAVYPPTGTSDVKGMTIEGNHFQGMTSYGMRLQGLTRPRVINNNVLDAGTSSDGECISLVDVADGVFSGNSIGQTTTGLVLHGIREVSGCTNNTFLDNPWTGTVVGRVIGATSGPVRGVGTFSYTGSSSQVAHQGLADTYVLAFATTGKALNPSADWGPGSSFRIVNAGATNFNFGTAGANLLIVKGNTYEIVHNGTGFQFLGAQGPTIESVLYNFAVHGGAVSTINLSSVLPTNTIITKVWYDVLTAPTSAGSATIAFSTTQAANQIVTATAFAAADFTLGVHAAIPTGAAASFVAKTIANKYVCITIAGAALTAGKIRVWYEYVVSE